MTISNMSIIAKCRTFSDPLYIDYMWTDLRHIIYYAIFFITTKVIHIHKEKEQKLNGVE